MKSFLPLVLACVSIVYVPTNVYAQQHRDWEDPKIVGINKLPYHATLQLPSMTNDCEEIVSLDGEWSFSWSKDPWSKSDNFYLPDYDVTSWDKIDVPGNWQLQGFGRPIYINISFPFKADQPRVTSEPPSDWYAYDHRNPVGQYVTDFDVTDAMKDKSLILHFGGVHSAFYVWINGEKVGYSQNPMSPAEFDITSYVKPGKNKLAVEVYRWSDGSYLEDQDMWRMSGIYRPVQLWVRPQQHITDYFVTAEWLGHDNPAMADKAQLNARIDICNNGKKTVKGLKAILMVDGKEYEVPVGKLAVNDTASVDISCLIDDVKLWSAEHPNLYPYSIELIDNKDNVIEHFDYNLGVTHVEVVGEVFKINGKNVKLRGVNRHDHHPRTGRYVDAATLERDIQLMKQANINMLRTSHYPDMPYLYELCDKYGIYVMDEACQESHGYGYANELMGNLPEWELAHVDRAQSLVRRDKNHPCVVFWSMGNEGGIGPNIKAMREAILQIDTTRIPFYDSDPRYSDVYDYGYPTPQRLKEVGAEITDKPVIAREYAHAMGNSMGHLQEYWDVIYADSTIVGAAIWDFVDQGLAQPIDPSLPHDHRNPSLGLVDGEYWAYGGDFGDMPNDGEFLINGLVGPDRVPHPHYYEVQYVYQPVDFKLDDNGVLVRINRDFFTDLDEYEYRTDTICVDGETVMNVYACLKEEKPWAEKGFVVARKQFVLDEYKFPQDINVTSSPQVDVSASGVKVNCQNGYVEFNNMGALSGWVVDGYNMIYTPLEPYFWKAFNDNQIASHLADRTSSWREAGSQRQLVEGPIVNNDTSGVTKVTYKYTLPVGADYSLTYSINSDCDIMVEAEYQPTAEDIELIPKFGMRMQIPVDYQSVRWYGRGPWENYPDRKRSAFIGEYEMPLADLMTEYIHPQDNGNRCDVRWMELSSPEHTLRIDGCQPLCIRAWDYAEEDVTVRHPHQLDRGHFINLNIDLNIHGVAGTDTWGQRALPEYTIDGNKPYSYKFILRSR